MGIALAMPLNKYEVCKVDISRCSDTVRLPKESTKEGILRKIFVDKPLSLYRKVTGTRPPQSDWQLARGRFNTIMYIALKCKRTGVEFGVANYHMVWQHMPLSRAPHFRQKADHFAV
jgi:2',5'-phosphodiesterase